MPTARDRFCSRATALKLLLTLALAWTPVVANAHPEDGGYPGCPEGFLFAFETPCLCGSSLVQYEDAPCRCRTFEDTCGPIGDEEDDAGAVDSGAVDSGAVDSGAVDSGAVDSGAVDSGATDAGVDAGGLVDGGFLDASTGDAGEQDAGEQDAGEQDAGAAVDGGAGPVSMLDAGVYVDAGLRLPWPLPGTLNRDAGYDSGIVEGVPGDPVPWATRPRELSDPGTSQARCGCAQARLDTTPNVLVGLFCGLLWMRARRQRRRLSSWISSHRKV